ncbi:MAG: helix-turn-helix domain-containing protein [Thermoanaerobacter sp.]|nr:helix-turn-helix domain-containing protein [Thermoanaerobacter sp.]
MEIRVGPIIRKIREQYGLEQQDLARTANISPSFLNDIEKSRSNPALDTFCRIAQTLGQNPGRLLNMALGITESTKSIPILGQIRAGLPIFAEENYEGGIEIPSDITADFALRVRGDSMIGAGILDGDYAICRKAETINAHNGQIVVAVRYETAEYAEATLKYFFVENGRVVLRAANPDFEDINFDEEGYHVAGIMVALLRYGAPDYRIYREYISTRDYALREWDEVIEKAATNGIKPSVIKELIDVQVEIAKRLKR